jgi:hypothetical protein
MLRINGGLKWGINRIIDDDPRLFPVSQNQAIVADRSFSASFPETYSMSVRSGLVIHVVKMAVNTIIAKIRPDRIPRSYPILSATRMNFKTCTWRLRARSAQTAVSAFNSLSRRTFTMLRSSSNL